MTTTGLAVALGAVVLLCILFAILLRRSIKSGQIQKGLQDLSQKPKK